MSKRVRTSLRASNKGRSLRPKAVLGRRSLAPGDLVASDLGADPGEAMEAAPESRDSEPTPSQPAPSSNIPERLTVPDPPVAPVVTAETSVHAPVEAFTAPEDPVAEDASSDASASVAAALAAAVERAEVDAPAEEGVAVDAEEKGQVVEVDAKTLLAPVPAVSALATEDEPRVEPAKAPDEGFDASGVSAEFFRKEEESLAPTIEEVPEDHAPRIVLSPAAVARRARFRRMVAGVVAFAGVISLAVIGKSIAAPRKHAPVAAAVPVVVAPTPPPAVAEPPKPEPVAEVKPAADTKPADPAPAASAEAKADEAKPEDAKKDDKADAAKSADDKKADDAKPEEKKAATEPDPAAAKKLQQETLALLNRGRSKEAIEKAKEAIAADPTDALAYLYLGSALQDSGHWKDGVDAYSECVRTATKGSVNECRIMGGHR